MNSDPARCLSVLLKKLDFWERGVEHLELGSAENTPECKGSWVVKSLTV